MRLPWEQIAMEVIEVSAPELAAKLDISEAESGWGLVLLVKWALARCPDHQPPSANDVVKGPTAAKQIARAAGFKGSADVYVKACASLSFPMVELVADGVRVRGLDRYDSAWGDRNEAAWKAWKSAHPEKYVSAERRRGSGGSPAEIRPSDPDPDPDPDADPDAHSTPPNPPLSQEGGEERKPPRRAPRQRARHLQPVPTPPAPPTPAQEAFTRLLDRVRARGASYAVTQLEKLQPELTGGELVLHAADGFNGDWVAEHYLPMLREEAAAGAGPPVALRYPPKPAGAFA